MEGVEALPVKFPQPGVNLDPAAAEGYEPTMFVYMPFYRRAEMVPARDRV
jgi:hypothetical protein